MDLQLERFSDINLKDSFFDSLRSSYPEFDEWYHKKEAAGATAYTYYINRELKDFLYLKIEEEELSDMVPVQPARKRLKVGTFKVDVWFILPASISISIIMFHGLRFRLF